MREGETTVESVEKGGGKWYNVRLLVGQDQEHETHVDTKCNQ